MDLNKKKYIGIGIGDMSGGGGIAVAEVRTAAAALQPSPILSGNASVVGLFSASAALEPSPTLASSATVAETAALQLVDNNDTGVVHRTGAVAGAAGSVLTFSCWFQIGSLPVGTAPIFDIGDGIADNIVYFRFAIIATGDIQIYMKDTVPSVKVNRITNDQPVSIDTLYHLYFTCDLTVPSASLYLDGSELTSFGTTNTQTGSIALASAGECTVGGRHANLNQVPNDITSIGEVWLDDSTQPLSDFYNLGRVYLGANGEVPIGSAPLIYLEGDQSDWNSASTLNKGTSGAWATYATGWTDV